MVAQPPFSMSERRSQDEETLLNATSFATASVCCWNFSTQIGASAATTAAAARWVAIFSAVLPSVHPSCENPTTANATAPDTAPHTAGFTLGWIFISSPWLWEKGTSQVSDQRGYIARGEATKTASAASRLCTSHPTSVTGRESARLGHYCAGRSSTTTEGALTVPSMPAP